MSEKHKFGLVVTASKIEANSIAKLSEFWLRKKNITMIFTL